MRNCECNPNAAILVESLRATGYTFPASIADIIDNSISAQARQIDIISLPDEHNPSLSIIDDGTGMSEDTLKEAMRFGSKDPLDKRNPHDLGRFGLGLKTAAFSQCRTLTVISKQENKLLGYCWDLDVIRETEKWTLNQLSSSEIENIENIETLKELPHGTLVLLQNFDRMQTRSETLAQSFSSSLTEMRKHLQLVFHRFLNDGSIIIRVNNDPLEGYQPFLEDHLAAQHSAPIYITLNGCRITLKIHTLPHASKLTSEDKKILGEEKQDKSGLYIYRNKRLITWGKWFGLIPRKLIYQLTRIQVDIPNSLDNIWDIDIKKSSASLPESVKKKIKQRIEDFVQPSEKVIKHRGTRETSEYGFWSCSKNRDGKYEFAINEDIPQLRTLSATLNDSQRKLLDNALVAIAKYLPFNAIASIYGEIDQASIIDEEKIWEDVLENIKIAQDNQIPIKPYLEALSCMEPYCQIKTKIQEELKKYE